MLTPCSDCASPTQHGPLCPPCLESRCRAADAGASPADRARHLIRLDLADGAPMAWLDVDDGLHQTYAALLLALVRLRVEIGQRQSARLETRTECVHSLQHHARATRAHLDGCADAGLKPATVERLEREIALLLEQARRLKGGAAIADVVDGTGRRIEKEVKR